MTYANESIVELLRSGFEYDLWANMRWFNALQLMRKQDVASPVLQHILTTQRIWLERCGVAVEGIPRAATKTAFEGANHAWIALVTGSDLNGLVDYNDFRGRPHKRARGEIAWHVINHGTFHRGHLRGLAQGEGFEEFTDTDLIYYFDEVRKR
ncbi:MAG TPA: hypothetical protein VG820_01665 [Fimbriimonadaceae bacterium]|nr:hypothetical protein [Fimbriimonadaceae bacterium]